MKKTYRQMVDFLEQAGQYVVKNEKTKLAYAIKKVTTRLKPHIADHNEKLEDSRVKLASCDEKGNMIVTDNVYSYTIANRQKLNEEARAIKKMTFEFDPYYATEVPEDLDYTMREAFQGFVIPEEIE